MKGGIEVSRLQKATLALSLALVALLSLAGIASAATPAWKLLAVTGPTNLPPKQSEIQRLTVEAEGGDFTLGQQTAEGKGTFTEHLGVVEFTEGINIAKVFLAFEPFAIGERFSTAAFPAGTTIIGISGSEEEPVLELSNPAEFSGEFEFFTTSSKEVKGVTVSTGAFHVGDEISGEFIPPGTTVTALGINTLTLSDFPTEGGPHTFVGSESTAAIPFNAPASVVQTELEALPVVGLGAVDVSGGPGGDVEHPYFVDFGGSLADKDVAALEGDGGNLEGEHAAIHVFTIVPGGPGTGEISINPANIGGAPTSGAYSVELGLPTGIVTSGPAKGENWNCTGGTGASIVTCTSGRPVAGQSPAANIIVPVAVQPSDAVSSSANVSIVGGAASSTAISMPITVSTQQPSVGVAALWAGSFDADGKEETQAGGHPYGAMTYFMLTSIRSSSGRIVPAGDSKDVIVDLPPGFVGNPMVTPRCPQSQVVPPFIGSASCNIKMSVGNFLPIAGSFGSVAAEFNFPIFNDVPPQGYAAEFTTKIVSPQQSLLGSVRASEDFGVRITAPNNPNFIKIYGAFAALEGQPAGANGKAFTRNATDCAEMAREAPVVRSKFDTWQQPGLFSTGGLQNQVLPAVTGCDQLAFHPSFGFQPTTTNGSSGTGAAAHLHIPQAGLSDPSQLATPDLKKAVVTLPQGLDLNPSAANGLEACSESQVGYLGKGFPLPNPVRFDEEAPTCPDGSKLGTVEVQTPVLEEALQGTIYLAAQEENPFDSLIAIYLVIDDARTGITLKLPGEVKPDPNTGLTATFDYNPQLPFEDMTLRFRGGGPHSELSTPEVCGPHTTTGSWTPWSAPESGPPAPTSDSFTISSGCASSASARPFSPSFEAGTTDPKAGTYSPMVIKINRKDGEQELDRLDFTLPLGVVGRLAGIPYCPEAAIAAAAHKSGKGELANPSCPLASRVGTVDTAAGVGSDPIHVGGNVYLAGPYEGAPISTVVVTPAVAGPFDLGTVVIRAPAFINLETAQIMVKSDPVPTVLKGLPLKLRSVVINVDRSGFILNPTNCAPQAFSASLHSSNGATAKPSNHFQVGGCQKLKFKPNLKLSLKGATRRSGHPALKAVVTYPKKGAYSNIARAQVGLPHSEFLDQGNLDKVCTQPELKSATCPKRAVYGHAKAWTPLLDKPLEGPVYIGVGYGHKLPDLVADLNGQVRILLHGKVDTTKHEGIRNTFEVVPDAPVSRFVLEMKGGKKYGLLENSENLCRKAQRASVLFGAQNGLSLHLQPLIANDCSKKKKSNGKKGHGKAKGGRKGHSQRRSTP